MSDKWKRQLTDGTWVKVKKAQAGVFPCLVCDYRNADSSCTNIYILATFCFSRHCGYIKKCKPPKAIGENMIVTPDEAQGKSCENQKDRCGAAGCMKWRWADNNHTIGYCGLAGKPRELEISDNAIMTSKLTQAMKRVQETIK